MDGLLNMAILQSCLRASTFFISYGNIGIINRGLKKNCAQDETVHSVRSFISLQVQTCEYEDVFVDSIPLSLNQYCR